MACLSKSYMSKAALERVVRESGRPLQSVYEILQDYEQEWEERRKMSTAAPVSSTFLQKGGAIPFNKHGLPEGMTWVSPSGKALVPLREPINCRQFTERGMKLLNMGKIPPSEARKAYKESSMELWKTINPGCMPDFTKLPNSTAHEHYERDNALIPPVDKRLHLQKNDFTEHTEQGASIMKALISDKR